MQISLSLNRLLFIAFALVLIIVVINSSGPVKADSATSHFMIAPVTFSLSGAPQLSTVVRLDSQTGDAWYAGEVPIAGGKHDLQWFKVRPPQ